MCVCGCAHKAGGEIEGKHREMKCEGETRGQMMEGEAEEKDRTDIKL